MISGYIRSFFERLVTAWGWIAAQIVGVAILLVGVVLWTRIPDKYGWQVVFTVLVPLVLVALMFLLQTGTMRKLQKDDTEKHVSFAWGATTLLVWYIGAILVWCALDWFDNQILDWASYLNSLHTPYFREHFFTYSNIAHCLEGLEWFTRWVILPAAAIPCIMATSLRGFKQCWLRVLRVICNWKWLLAVLVSALLNVYLFRRFYMPDPYGSVSAQKWRIILKLAATYGVAIFFWLLLLALAAVIFSRTAKVEAGLDKETASCLCMGRRWIAAIFGWVLLTTFFKYLAVSYNWTFAVRTSLNILLHILIAVLLVKFFRAMLQNQSKRASLVVGAIAMAIGFVVIFIVAIHLCGQKALLPVACEPLILWGAFALLLPVTEAAAQWGFLLPWKRVFSVVACWKWLLATACAVFVGWFLPFLIHATILDVDSSVQPMAHSAIFARDFMGGLFAFVSFTVLFGFLSALLGRQIKPTQNP